MIDPHPEARVVDRVCSGDFDANGKQGLLLPNLLVRLVRRQKREPHTRASQT